MIDFPARFETPGTPYGMHLGELDGPIGLRLFAAEIVARDFVKPARIVQVNARADLLDPLKKCRLLCRFLFDDHKRIFGKRFEERPALDLG